MSVYTGIVFVVIMLPVLIFAGYGGYMLGGARGVFIVFGGTLLVNAWMYGVACLTGI